MIKLEINGKQFGIVDEGEHPTDDPDYPSYHCPEYQELVDDVEFVADMVQGKSAWISINKQKINHNKLSRYLPSFEGEDLEDYRIRYLNTPWLGFFKRHLNKFPGLLSQLTYTSYILSSIKQYWGDCDKQNTSFPTFFLDADYRVIRDQFCGILVDAEKNDIEKIVTPNDLERLNNRPYLKLVERKDLINFIHNERGELSKVVIRENVALNSSSYGKEFFIQYREFNYDGSYQVTTVVKSLEDDGDNNLYVHVLDEGRVSIGRIPIVIYSFDRINPFLERSPVYNLAELQKAYYELSSQDYVSLRQTNFPIYVRKGIQRQPGSRENTLGDPNKKYKILSSSRMQDLPAEASLEIIAPPSTWAEINESRLNKILELANQQANDFIGLGHQSKTAEQVISENTNRNSDILTLANRKLECLQNIEFLWGLYLGIKVDRSEDSSAFRLDLSSLGLINKPTKESSTTYSSEDSTGIIGKN